MSEEEEELEVMKVVSNLARGDNWRSNHTEELRKPPMEWTLVWIALESTLWGEFTSFTPKYLFLPRLLRLNGEQESLGAAY